MPELKYGDSGAAVVALQRALEAQDYPLVRFGADGHYGRETEEAIDLWAYDRRLIADWGEATPDGDVPEWLYDAITDAAQRCKHQPLTHYPLLHDVRGEAWEGRRKRRNPIERVDTICLHQMAVKDSDLEGWKRWRKLAIHGVVTEGPNAAAYWMHDVTWKLPHGHGWNRRSVGIEIEGYFAGCHPKHFWKPKSRPNRKPMLPTKQQLEAATQLCLHLIDEVGRQGGRIKYIGAHRQSFGTKASDPGNLLWQGVAVPLLNEPGLDLEQAPTLSRGWPIPECWDDERNSGVKYHHKR